jgi:diguanylate cyclase (GGDEF)-like protein
MDSRLLAGRFIEGVENWSRRKMRILLWPMAAFPCLLDWLDPTLDTGMVSALLICACVWHLARWEGYAFATSIWLIGLGSHVAREPLAVDALHACYRLGCSLLLAGAVAHFRRAFERERFLARHDLMTGAMNRASFDQQARRMVALSARARRPLMLAVIDLDNFKSVNDEHGHAAGDAVIRAFAESAANALRRRDMLGRLGGDEFAVIMTIDSAERAREIAWGLHQRLSAVLASLARPVTISTGALVVPPSSGLSLDVLLHQADGLMYHGKRTEKGKLVVGIATPDDRARILDDSAHV